MFALRARARVQTPARAQARTPTQIQPNPSEQYPLIAPQRIFIFEHVCGGGMAGEALPDSLAAQGSAMLRAAIDDWVSLGCEVTTQLDARLTMRIDMRLERAQVQRVADRKQTLACFDDALRRAEAVLVIAPELSPSEFGLVDWMQRAQTSGIRNLGCDSTASAVCGDKLALCSYLQEHDVPTIPTRGDTVGERRVEQLGRRRRHRVFNERRSRCHQAALGRRMRRHHCDANPRSARSPNIPATASCNPLFRADTSARR